MSLRRLASVGAVSGLLFMSPIELRIEGESGLPMLVPTVACGQAPGTPEWYGCAPESFNSCSHNDMLIIQEDYKCADPGRGCW